MIKKIAIKNQWLNLKAQKIKRGENEKKNNFRMQACFYFIKKKQMLLEAKKPNIWTNLKKKERRGIIKKNAQLKKLYRRHMNKKKPLINFVYH